MNVLSNGRLILIITTLIRAAWGDNEGVCSNEGCFTKEGSQGNGTRTRALSRTKRFIVFPDGSSFQLVFCVQTMALIPIGDIFLFGNTAALAWNLPTDPKIFHMFKDYGEVSNRRADTSKNVYYLDDSGKVLAKVPFKKPAIVNPAFAKRSIGDKVTFREKLKIKIDRMKMHGKQFSREFLNKEHLDEDSVDFHRKSRVELFEKVEALITAVLFIGWGATDDDAFFTNYANQRSLPGKAHSFRSSSEWYLHCQKAANLITKNTKNMTKLIKKMTAPQCIQDARTFNFSYNFLRSSSLNHANKVLINDV